MVMRKLEMERRQQALAYRTGAPSSVRGRADRA